MSAARIRIQEDAYGRLHLRWWADDSQLWHQILDSFKARFPTHGDRSFSSRTKTWSVPQRHYTRLAEWVDRWFEPEDQEWGEEEPAGRAYGHTYSDTRSSYRHGGKTPASTSAIEAAYAHLCLTPDAPAELVKTAHRWWVRQLHPDTGHGDTHRMATINAAADAIRASNRGVDPADPLRSRREPSVWTRPFSPLQRTWDNWCDSITRTLANGCPRLAPLDGGRAYARTHMRGHAERREALRSRAAAW
jgi:hypothetical protein